MASWGSAASKIGNRTDIAIVGIGCRFPGARNVNEYWDLLSEPKPQLRTVPDSRWRRDAFYNDDFRDTSAAYSDKMALLDDVGQFDAGHYGIPPRRARSLDPQHRLLVDLTREALQDAGWEAGGFEREDTSVIMSLSDSGYREMSTLHLRLRQLAGGEFGRSAGAELAEAGSAVGGLHATAMAGLLLNMGPSSISSVFDLHGESYALDAACSGGLTAVANAVFALRAGRCRIAVAGGAQLVLTPDLLVGLCRIGAVSRSGECRPFDERADGFVLGEGAGVLVLRPLADAQAAGDRVYAVIRGVGLSNDGTVKGGMMPQESGQLLALRRAYRDADVEPGSVGYLEAHGTATSVGDDVEINALGELRRDAAAPAYLGAAKSVVGHSLGTAGIAGLIKSVLSVHKGQILPQPDFEPAGHLALDEAGLRVAGEVTPWVSPDGPRRAGVSAFGFGGTNVHVVLEEFPAAAEVPPSGPQLLLLTARDRAGLARHAREVAEVLSREPLPLATVAATLARRTLFAERLAVVAEDCAVAQLMAASVALESGQTGELAPGTYAGVVAPGAEVPAPDLPLLELAALAVTGPGLRPTLSATPPCTLPPSPLSPREHWVVDAAKRAKAQALAPLGGRPSAEPVATQELPSARDVLAVVLEEVARTSAFPATDLSAAHLLIDDLGFDSLMLTELEANLRKRFPGQRFEIDQERGVTIGAVAGLITPAVAVPFASVGDGVLAAEVSLVPEVVAPSVAVPFASPADAGLAAEVSLAPEVVAPAVAVPFASVGDAGLAAEVSLAPEVAAPPMAVPFASPADAGLAAPESVAPAGVADAPAPGMSSHAEAFASGVAGQTAPGVAPLAPEAVVADGAGWATPAATVLTAPAVDAPALGLSSASPSESFASGVAGPTAPAAPLVPKAVGPDEAGLTAPGAAPLVPGTVPAAAGRTSPSATVPMTPAAVTPAVAGTRAVRMPPAPETVAFDPATASIDDFPEAAAIDARLREFSDLGVANPYFRKHQGRMTSTTSVGGREFLSFSSYNYLGLSGHPTVTAAVHDAVERYGTSVSGSRLLAGDRDLTRQLETELASFLGTDDCLALVSGHATNVSAIGHLVGPGDLVIHDSLAHDSILQGCALSGATRRPFPHNDVTQLADILRRTRARFRRVLIVVEGAYSMDGDLADLPGLIDLKKRYGALLMVDEAHSIGTVGATGAGVGEHYSVDRSDVDLWMGTLSKSLAGCGGYLAGSARTIQWLRYSLPGFVYSVGLTPANAAASLAALRVLRAEPVRLARLRVNSRLFLELSRAAALPTGSASATPIVPCVVGDSTTTLRLATTLYDHGIIVDPILYPAVDESQTRLRFFLTSDHEADQLKYTVATVARELTRLRES
ncbi:aminotransferase class I/II-fold pyridoxal phosphate-dependent enzyme [Amycolatopsis rhabdoformis]|uniref:Aminotransferase class I/II-fold pyridoxal phosphate-dependent enzyme n=1 Tax=Amycolatopsis rhabdoformis TaxID=1448059 RepID=A0ABZ1HWH9_9PSEU|nr:aminotransferase class I/II-fold pyridoxal phosphate-dependent enzyme [Amycolatopsis rhabdoformis]WSE26518.1 aminotransferase class I/II-fold pyridoxal phosphate-dependent enzyme [Amycolatopsis rhabdoformis]